MAENRLARLDVVEKYKDVDFLREIAEPTVQRLRAQGGCGVQLVVSDGHQREGERLKAAAAKVLTATWQRCRVHFMRHAHVVRIFPNEVATVRLVGTLFEEQTDEW